MAACSHVMHTLRLPLRLECWGWAPGRLPKTFYRNLAMNSPYAETSAMVALRQLPISQTPLDSSIFETTDEKEYNYVSASLPPLSAVDTPHAIDTSSSLVRLINERRYAEADRVKSEMNEIGLEIVPDDAYEYAAIHALTSDQSKEARLETFMEWFSLVPSRCGGSTPKFGRILQLLLKEDTTDTTTLSRFALACIAKGYVQTVPKQVIPFLVRFADPTVSMEFLQDLRAHGLKYYPAKSSALNRKLKGWYSQAIKGYTQSLRLPHAVETLRLAKSNGIKPSHQSISLLLQHLKKDETATPQVLEFVTREAAFPVLKSLSAFPAPHTSDLTTEQINPFQFVSINVEDLQATLRTLRKTVGTARHPPAVVLAQFFESYISSQGRLTAIHLLRRKTFRAGHRARSHWAMAEMLYYGKQGQWAQVLSTFDHYFYPSGVPQELHAYKQLPLPLGRGSQKQTIGGNDGPRDKLFPSIYHTCLVWRSLTEITNKSTVLPVIYSRLLAQAMTMSERVETPSEEGAVSSINVPPSQFSDAAHFTPFLYSLFRKAKSRLMMGIFSDMSHLGIQPRLPQMALLAGSHAGRGDIDEAFKIIDMVEEWFENEKAEDNLEMSPEDESRRYLTLYLPTFSGFLLRKNLRGAHLVKDRLFERGYVQGSNDAVEENLIKMEEVAHWWRTRGYQMYDKVTG